MTLNKMESGAIIIAGSGMCTGGQILHHLKHNLWRPQCHVMIVGYQARGSIGRRMVDGHDYIKIHGETIRNSARIHTVGGLSAHGDQEDLLRWYRGFANRPPVFLVHGEIDSAEAFRQVLREDGADASLTRPGMKLDLSGDIPAQVSGRH